MGYLAAAFSMNEPSFILDLRYATRQGPDEERCMITLEGKTIVVTGASRGIGEAIARACIDHGARVVIASRKQADLDQLAAALPADRVLAVAAHTGKPAEV